MEGALQLPSPPFFYRHQGSIGGWLITRETDTPGCDHGPHPGVPVIPGDYTLTLDLQDSRNLIVLFT